MHFKEEEKSEIEKRQSPKNLSKEALKYLRISLILMTRVMARDLNTIKILEIRLLKIHSTHFKIIQEEPLLIDLRLH